MHLYTPIPATIETPQPSDFWDASAADWISGGSTLLATFVALSLGLWSVWTARSAKKQQLRQEKLDKARVYCWANPLDPVRERGGQLWVRNDTDVPLYYVEYEIFIVPAPPAQNRWTGHVMLPPGETRTVELDHGGFAGIPMRKPMVFAALRFNDVDGFGWIRHPDGSLTTSDWKGPMRMPISLIEGRPASL